MDIRQFALLQGKFSKMISPSPADNPTRRRWPQGLLSLALALLLLSCQAAPTPPVIAPDPFASNPRVTPIIAAGAPAQGSAANEQPPSTWQIYASTELSITLTYPAHWRPAASDDIALFRGEDGFFGLSAAHMVAETAEAVCAEWVKRDPNPRTGSQPPVEPLQVAGQPACLILPTDDQSQPDGWTLLFVQYPRAYEHNRTLILVADMAHIRQIGASLRFALPPQTLDSLRGALTYVELDIFSGRPNPVWLLPDAQQHELTTRLSGLAPGLVAPYPDRLGYRAVLIHFNQPPYGMPETIEVFGGSACYELGGVRTCRADANRAVEHWLLQTADRAQIDAGVLDDILAEINTIAAVQAGDQPETWSYESPDKRWRMVLMMYGCVPTETGNTNAYEMFSLVRSADGASAVVDRQLIYCEGLGAHGLGGLFWSLNNRYYYYTTAREGTPDGCGFWQPPTWRLDVATMRTQELGYSWRSTDGSKLVTWRDQELMLWDTDGAERGRWQAPAPVPLTALRWAPDSGAAAYLLTPSPCDQNTAGKSYLVRVNFADFSQSVLIESAAPIFDTLDWLATDVIRLTDREGKTWIFDRKGLRQD